ncbi:hypothetical protein B7P33_17515 [Sediminicola luteus]|uniref:Uncharacterized protein n=1 Tax=Sediminicola luteus TaxID=319238 RepID=A0A2A4G3R1_9FLAO|nr:hypothetical protein B7P33_17515 [Sediminicola luteus]
MASTKQRLFQSTGYLNGLYRPFSVFFLQSSLFYGIVHQFHRVALGITETVILDNTDIHNK